MKTKAIILILLIGIAIALLWGVGQCNQKRTNAVNLDAANDTTKLYKDKEGRLTGEIQAYQVSSEKEIGKLKAEKGSLLALIQDERKSVPGKIRSAVAAALHTRIRDTMFLPTVRWDTVGDTIWPVYLDTAEDVWHRLEVRAAHDKITTNLTTRDSLGIFISWARGGIFKSKVPVATVKSSSPYTDSIDVRSVEVEPKKSVIGKVAKVGLLVGAFFLGRATK